MFRRDASEAWPALPGADLSAFGFDAPDAAWFHRIRAVDRPILPRTLGSFESVEEISQGAQGVVYRARQPHTQRIVALKRLLNGSFSTRESLARFHREMEAAVALQHPSIVSVYGLEVIDGQPVLAMEWVDGVPIDRWAESGTDGRRTAVESLETFLKLCDAVHHAHQRGVIHRDLKPSNILVDARGVPHVLDFGLAKLIRADESAADLTQTKDFLGTPAYAAPEQVGGRHDAVDIRTDVYALGALLHQVLTGQLPFEFGRDLGKLLHAIEHVDPPPPSSIDRRLDADLDAVVLRALAKQPHRRYPSVDALAADLRRYLAGEPVDARRGRRGYVLRKLLRRHRLAALTAISFVAVLTASAVALSVMYARQGRLLAAATQAHDAEARARRQSQKGQTALQHILTAVSQIGKGADLPVRRAMLDDAAARLRAEFADEPEALAAALDAVGRTYRHLGLYEQAEENLRAALGMRRELFDPEHADVAASLNSLGELLLDTGRLVEAEPLFRDALNIRQRLAANDDAAGDAFAQSLNNVALIAQGKHEYQAAEALHRAALEQFRRIHGAKSPEIAESLNWIGCCLANRNEFGDAAEVFRETLALQRSLHGDHHRDTAASAIALAKTLHIQGDYTGAEPLLREAVATYRALLGDSHDNVAWGLHRLGTLLHSMGRDDEAEVHLREALAIYRTSLGDDDRYVSFVLDSLGTLLMERGDFDGAEPLLEESLGIWRNRFGADSQAVAWKQNRIGELRQLQGDDQTAEALLRGALTHKARAEGVEFGYLIRTLHSLGALLADGGRYDQAESAYLEALATQRDSLGLGHPETRKTVARLVELYELWGRPEKAELLRVASEPQNLDAR